MTYCRKPFSANKRRRAAWLLMAGLTIGVIVGCDNDAEPETAGPISVTLAFSYGCEVCRPLDEQLQSWADRGAITLERLPVGFNQTWLTYARTFHALQRAPDGLPLATHYALFEAAAATPPAVSKDDIIDVFTGSEEHTIAAKHLADHYLAPATSQALNRTEAQWRAQEIYAVPAMIINGVAITEPADLPQTLAELQRLAQSLQAGL